MYCCDECNARKGDRCPPESARAGGYRFFRPDIDEHVDHFELSGLRINPKTKVAEYTIEALDLNRTALRRLRDLRTRLTECEEAVAQGVLALRSAHLDRLPVQIKGKINRAIADARSVADKMANEIDDLLRAYAKSDLVDPDPESHERAKERDRRLGAMKVVYPGSWRAPRERKARR
jgi:hypothetical protein